MGKFKRAGLRVRFMGRMVGMGVILESMAVGMVMIVGMPMMMGMFVSERIFESFNKEPETHTHD